MLSYNYAGDTLIYRITHTPESIAILQRYLDTLSEWESNG